MRTPAHGTARTVTTFVVDAITPKAFRIRVERKLRVAGIRNPPYLVLGVLCYSALALAIVYTLILLNFSSIALTPLLTRAFLFILVTPVAFVLLWLLGLKGLKLYIEASIYRRVREMEDVFPEFLSELSLNLKAGQDLERSIAAASAEQFGALSKEMRSLAMSVSLGFDIETALRRFSEDYPSEMMSESFELILISWRKGAQTPRLMDRIVSNLKTTRGLRQKIVASVANYQIFLATVTLFIAPAMMALAYHFISLVRSITTEVMQVTSQSILPFTINAVRFEDNQFKWFSVLTLLIIAIFTALIVSFTESGSLRSAWSKIFKYSVMCLLSYWFFLFILTGLFKMFGT